MSSNPPDDPENNFGKRIKDWFRKFKPKKARPVPPPQLPTRDVQSEVQVCNNSSNGSSNNTAQAISVPSQSSIESTDTNNSAVVTVPISPVQEPKTQIATPQKTAVAPPRIPRNDITIFQTIMTRIIPARSTKKRKKRKIHKKKQPPPSTSKIKILKNQVDVWQEIQVGQPIPDPETLIMALFTPIDSLDGESKKQYVACRYLHGNPVIGRVWADENGKICASFPASGREYRLINNSTDILLLKKPTGMDAFIYDWRTFAEAVTFDEDKIWHPVVLGSTKGNISPAVVPVDDKKILGQADVRNEKASYGYNGLEREIVGPEVRNTIILCRKKF